MFVSWKRFQEVVEATFTAEILAVLVMVYVFLAPMPFYLQILVVLLVTLLVTLSARSQPATELAIDQASQTAWMSELTLREALDAAAAAIARGEFKGFDWRAATEIAAKDILQNQADDKLRKQMSSATAVSILTVAFSVVFTALRGLIAYGIARLLQGYAPRFVLLVTGMAT